MDHKFIMSSHGSIGSIESAGPMKYGQINSNIVRNMNVEAIEEEVKGEEDLTPAKKYEKDDEDEDAFFDELDEDAIDEGVTTNNMMTFDMKLQSKSQIHWEPYRKIFRVNT